MNLRNRVCMITLCFLAIIVGSVPAYSQSNGRIEVIVLDEFGKPAKNVKLTLVRGWLELINKCLIFIEPKIQHGKERELHSDKGDKFYFSLIPPGIYSLTIEHKNYMTIEQVDIVIHSGKTKKLFFDLIPKGDKNGRLVHAPKPMVDLGSTTSGVVLERTFFENIPIGK